MSLRLLKFKVHCIRFVVCVCLQGDAPTTCEATAASADADATVVVRDFHVAADVSPSAYRILSKLFVVDDADTLFSKLSDLNWIGCHSLIQESLCLDIFLEACRDGCPRIAKRMLDVLREPNAFPPLYTTKFDNGTNGFLLAVRNGHVGVVEALLSDARITPDVCDKRCTWNAVRNIMQDERATPNHVHILKLLLQDARINPLQTAEWDEDGFVINLCAIRMHWMGRHADVEVALWSLLSSDARLADICRAPKILDAEASLVAAEAAKVVFVDDAAAASAGIKRKRCSD